MKNKIKYRQPIFCEGKFSYWHYWGDVDGGFLSPINANLKRDSQRFISLLDKNGKEIYDSDRIINDSRNGGKPHQVKILDNGRIVGDYGLQYDLWQEADEIEVIGNKYERNGK